MVFHVFLFVGDNQQNNFDLISFGPQDGGFDTSAWGDYTNYYPVRSQKVNNNNNNNQSCRNPRTRINQENNQQTSNTVGIYD